MGGWVGGGVCVCGGESVYRTAVCSSSSRAWGSRGMASGRASRKAAASKAATSPPSTAAKRV